MAPPTKPKGGGSTDRQNVHISQSDPLPVANAHSSAEFGGAFVTEDNLNPEINAIEQRFRSRGPPNKPIGTRPKPRPPPPPPPPPKPQSSSTQPRTLPSGQLPQANAEVGGAFATEDNLNPEINAIEQRFRARGPPARPAGVPKKPVHHGQPHQVHHGQPHHGQPPQVHHGQPHHGQLPQVHHGQPHHGQPPQVHHGQPHHGQPQVHHGQPLQVHHSQPHHGQPPQAHHSQPPQVHHGQPPQVHHGQIPPTEGGTSSHDQQRNADRRRKNDRILAVTAYGEPQRGRR